MPLAQPSLLRSHRAKSRCPSIVHAFTVSRLRPKAEVYPERLQGSRRARHERSGGMFVDESIEKIKRPAMHDRLKRLKFSACHRGRREADYMIGCIFARYSSAWETGRSSSRERACTYGKISVVAVLFRKNMNYCITIARV